MHSSHDFVSNDTDFERVYHHEYENGFNMPQQSIRLHSPLSLSLISESKTTKSEPPQHSWSYSSSSGSSSSSGPTSSSGASMSGRHGRAGRNHAWGNRSGRDTDLYGYGYDEEEENVIELSDEGYDSYDASPRFRSRTRSPRRAHTTYPFSAPTHSYTSSSFSPSPTSLPYTYSLPHPEEIEDETETSFPDSNSTDGMQPEYTPSCNEALRRQWNALAFRVRFSAFRARRRMRVIVGKGRKY
ncbi:hypothetical protein J3R30DRAFT_2894354 [Lentinula aciculospora]|uniref:Uncharacterized protein n=1 Tax=Lentinula aciculospora TaxID=153920 RepID=A0A9W9DNQ9_9AGAR|nr:hypothetical protein J3R30DRAFT_2894354 [Lentinula aciculospora]